MKLNCIEFGGVFCASGARNATGKGYPFHRLFKYLGLDYTGSTLITKTVTTSPNRGNMPLRHDGLTPRSWKPDCIVVKPWKGIALNAVGLSNFGAGWLFRQPDILRHRRPRIISFMPIGKDVAARIEEVRCFTEMLLDVQSVHKPRERRLTGPIAIQLNASCPNVGHAQQELAYEVDRWLRLLGETGVAIVVKFNALIPIGVAATIAEHDDCHGVAVSNTIPWGSIPAEIPWKKLFGSNTSPLAKYGGGGLSGKPLLPLVEQWITQFRPHTEKPIMGGGGILCKKDADRLIAAGADAIELGAVSMLRPWRVQGIIQHVNSRFGT